MTKPTQDSSNKLAAPSGEWLEKWKSVLALSPVDDDVDWKRRTVLALTAIYAEVYEEASNDCEATLASLADRINTFAREEGAEEAEDWQLEQLQAVLDRVVFALRLKRIAALEKTDTIKTKARRETLEEISDKLVAIMQEDTPEWMTQDQKNGYWLSEFSAWLHDDLAEQLKEADGET